MSEETENQDVDKEQEGASPVIDAVADALQAPKPEVDEAISPTLEHGLTRLEQAQALAELAADESAEPTTGLFTHFKNLERRTMRIVRHAGQFFQQEV